VTELEAWATARPLAWNDSSRAVLHDALARATPQPWPVDLGDQEVVFRDPSGGPTLDSAALYRCGAALAAAWTVLRVLGHDLVAEFPEKLGQLAVLRVIGRSSPAAQDWRRYAAIRDLTTPDAVLTPAPPAAVQAIIDDGAWPETALEIVDDSAWPDPDRPQWPFTPGSAILVLTNGNARCHHVLAGAAVHRARLSAAASGFRAEVITGPRPRAVALPGFPHALLRFGTPG
jgi:hypothetical protein